ncbi:MAG: EamA family transporter [Dehalococcoidia bacterium]
MTWVFVALLSAAVSGLVNLFDKTVIYRYAHTPYTLPLMIGLSQSLVGAVILLTQPVPDEATLSAVAWGLGSGALFGLSAQFLMRMLYSQEVSRTVPVFQTFPIYTALIAVFFLGDSISPLQWLAIIATVSGAVMLSLRIDRQYRRLFLHYSFFVLMTGSFISATAHITASLAVADLPVLYAHGLRMLALGAVFIVANVRPSSIREVTGFFRSRSPAVGLVAVNEIVTANIGMFLMLWALSMGPVALVTTLIGTRSFFVVLYSTVIALIWRGFLGEQTSRGAVTMKVACTALIVAGIAGVTIR